MGEEKRREREIWRERVGEETEQLRSYKFVIYTESPNQRYTTVIILL